MENGEKCHFTCVHFSLFLEDEIKAIFGQICKVAKCMGLYLPKYWSNEDRIFFPTCTSLSYTRQYNFLSLKNNAVFHRLQHQFSTPKISGFSLFFTRSPKGRSHRLPFSFQIITPTSFPPTLPKRMRLVELDFGSGKLTSVPLHPFLCGGQRRAPQRLENNSKARQEHKMDASLDGP